MALTIRTTDNATNRDVYNSLVHSQESMLDALKNDRGHDFLAHEQAYNQTVADNPALVNWLKKTSVDSAETSPKKAAGALRALPEYFSNQARALGIDPNVKTNRGLTMNWEMNGVTDKLQAQQLARVNALAAKGAEMTPDDMALKTTGDWALRKAAASEMAGTPVYGGAGALLSKVTDTVNAFRTELPHGLDLPAPALYTAAMNVSQLADGTGITEGDARGMVGSVMAKLKAAADNAPEPAKPVPGQEQVPTGVRLQTKDPSQLFTESVGLTKRILEAATQVGSTPVLSEDGKTRYIKNDNAADFAYFVKGALDRPGAQFSNGQELDGWLTNAKRWYVGAADTINRTTDRISRDNNVTDPKVKEHLRSVLRTVSSAAFGVVPVKDVEPEVVALANELGIKDPAVVRNFISGKDIAQVATADTIGNPEALAKTNGVKYEELSLPQQQVVGGHAAASAALVKAANTAPNVPSANIIQRAADISSTLDSVPEQPAKDGTLTAAQAGSLAKNILTVIAPRFQQSNPQKYQGLVEAAAALQKQADAADARLPSDGGTLDEVAARLARSKEGVSPQQYDWEAKKVKEAMGHTDQSLFKSSQIRIINPSNPSWVTEEGLKRTMADTNVSVNGQKVPLSLLIPPERAAEITKQALAAPFTAHDILHDPVSIALQEEAVKQLAQKGVLTWTGDKLGVSQTGMERLTSAERAAAIPAPKIRFADKTWDLSSQAGVKDLLREAYGAGDSTFVDTAKPLYDKYKASERAFNGVLVDKLGVNAGAAPAIGALGATSMDGAARNFATLTALTDRGGIPAVANSRLQEALLKVKATADENEKKRAFTKEMVATKAANQVGRDKFGARKAVLLKSIEAIDARESMLAKTSQPLPGADATARDEYRAMLDELTAP